MNVLALNTSSNVQFHQKLEEIDAEAKYLPNAYNYSKGYMPSVISNILGDTLRDVFYLPYSKLKLDAEIFNPNIKSDRDVLVATGKYFSHFKDMFTGEVSQADPTFSQFDKFKDHFNVFDTTIKIKSDDAEYHFQIRVVESKDFDGDSNGVRFILFSFYDHKQVKNGCKKDWDPKSLEAIGLAPVEILQALKENDTHIDSLVCFSLGALTLDAVKAVKEDVLPETIIIDRGLTSIKKVSSAVLSWPLHKIIYNLAWCYGLDADPETHFPQHLKALQEKAQNKKIVVIESTVDSYFSGNRGYSPSYIETLKKTGATVYHGKFFIPMMIQRAQHAWRRDHMLNNQLASAQTNDFIESPVNGTLADSLSELFTSKEGAHTSFLVGGNKDSLNSLLYTLTPVLNSYIAKKDAR